MAKTLCYERRVTRNEIRPITRYALRVTRYSLFIVFLLLSFISVSHAAIWQTATVTSELFSDVSFYDNSNGFAVGQRSGVFKTTDSGVTWSKVGTATAESSNLSYMIQAYSTDSALLMSRNHLTLWQYSGGAISEFKIFSNFGGFGGIFSRGSNIYAVGAGTTSNFAKSTNGGVAWTEGLISTNSLDAFTCVNFISDSVGWAGGYRARSPGSLEVAPMIWKTTDGGSTWTNVYLYSYETLVGLAAVMTDIFALDENNIWACNWDQIVRKSTNGGSSWTEIPVIPGAPAALINNIKFSNQNVGWLDFWLVNLTYSGIYRTLDGGSTWSRQEANLAIGLDILPTSKKVVATTSSGEVVRLFSPQITSVSTREFTQGITTSVTIIGQGFDSPTLSFSKSGITAESITVVSTSELTVSLRLFSTAEIGASTLTISNLDLSGTTDATGITVNTGEAVMTVTSVQPTSAYRSEQFNGAINGTNIPDPGSTGTIEISLGAGVTITSATWLSGSQVAIACTVEGTAEATTRDISLTIKGSTGSIIAQATKTAAFTVNAPPDPGTLPDAQSILPRIGNSGVWNPKTDGDLPVQVKVPVAGSYNIMVANESGIMYKTIKNLNVGYNKVVIPSTTELINGVHVLIFQDPKTGKTVKAKFAVNQ